MYQRRGWHVTVMVVVGWMLMGMDAADDDGTSAIWALEGELVLKGPVRAPARWDGNASDLATARGLLNPMGNATTMGNVDNGCVLQKQHDTLVSSCPLVLLATAIHDGAQVRDGGLDASSAETWCQRPWIKSGFEQIYLCAPSIRFETGLALPTTTAAPSQPVARWVAGGDADQTWTTSATSQYYACGSYDLCNTQYAVDGLSEDASRGKTFDMNGPLYSPLPQYLTVTFSTPKQLLGWRIWVPVCSYRLKTVALEAKATTGNQFTPIADSTITSPSPAIVGGLAPWELLNATWSEPLTVSTLRVKVSEMHPCAQNPSSLYQIYMAEVQFLEAL